MLNKNVHITRKKNHSPWNKISIGSWRPVGDSQVYCELKLNTEKVESFLKNESVKHKQKITITHFFGKVMGQVLKDVPELNSLIRFNKMYFRDQVNIFFHIANGADLSGHRIREIDKKSLVDISTELNDTAKKVRGGDDPSFKKIKGFWSIAPNFLAKTVLDLISFLNYSLNINFKPLGVPKDAFGGLMITNIGSLGFDSAFVPYTRIPMVMALGKIGWNAVCNDSGEITSKKQLSVCITFDHRVIDGARGSIVAKSLEKYFDNPDLILL
jgi:pyruvate/2-oxoglutarate dehydrogenase complex dihydrolipoamide acyltransferase (E2) component